MLPRIALAVSAACLALSCSGGTERADGRITIEYWEKWSGFEKDAMQAIVDDYNASQDRVFVNFVSQSELERKLLLATSGGNPPDLSGFWSYAVASFVDMGVLTPLDSRMQRDGISRDDYLKSVGDICEYRGYMWALPATPASLGLHINVALFREAGLDPDNPPSSIAEFDEACRRLAVQRPDGGYERMGYIPTDPGWWQQMWGFWFGDMLVSEDGRTVTCDSPESIASLEWTRSFCTNYDYRNLRLYEAAYRGQFASSGNAFISGRMGMVLQGVWMANFINEFGPGLEWTAAPFPSAFDTQGEPVTIVETDILVIPRGSRHPEEAWDFIKYVQRQDVMEKLCTLQLKFSPLAEVSADFDAKHPNPHIGLFRRLAESKNARAVPQIPVWTEYRDELIFAHQRAWADPEGTDPAEAMRLVKERIQPRLDEANRRWDRVAKERLEEWSQL